MDLRHQMSVDHANIRQLADQLLRAAGNQGARGRDNLFEQLDDEVRRHVTIFEAVVAPALASSAAAPSRDHHEAHRDLERQLDGLAAGDKSSNEWTARFETFSDALDRAFGEHMQMVGSTAANVDGDELGRAYARAKIKAIRSSGYVSRWRGRRGRIAGIGLGLGLAALAAVAWQRRSRAATADVDRTTRRRLRFRTGSRRDQPSAAQISVVS